MEGQRWLPLEANPEVTNQFLKQLGLHPNWQFVDVYGMDPELLSMVPRPVCAVLLLFPITEKYEVFRTEEEEKIKSQGQDVTSSVYFMKQTISNACGTIGLIHAIANNKDKMHFESGSTLKKFLEESVSMSPEERARYLENYDAIRVTHETSAHEGQTEIGPELTSVPIFLYFICGTPTTARRAKQCRVCTWDPNWQTLGRQSETCTLNCCATRPGPLCFYIMLIFASY
uniref:Ubiquitin carboxyl-terminal hydrolase n=1 Tax=Equus asinus TaxID=9793 RepID=A0A9L0JHF2_EQUAS